MRIMRVFPRRTNITPDDTLVSYGTAKTAPPIRRPGEGAPDFDEVHVSCAFTWHLRECEHIAEAWRLHMPPGVPVKVGGPALDDPGGPFVPDRYIKRGVSISSRGCPGHCPWCFVPEREGPLRLLPICPGNIIQDNNPTAWPIGQFRYLCRMLAAQRRIEIKGGLEARRFTADHRDALQMVEPSRVKEVWFSADDDGALTPLARVADLLRPMFGHYADGGRRKLRCYVLLGHGGETIARAEARLERVWELGFLPFAQLYRDKGGKKTTYSAEWRALERAWARPAATYALHRTS